MPLSPAERERRRKAKAELAASTKAYQAAARPVVKKVKVKKRPLPVPSMEAGLYVPTIEKEPKTKGRPPVTFGRTRRRRAIPHKYEYVPPEDFYLPPAEGGPRAAAVDRYNQRRLRSERTQRRLEKSRARGLMRVLKRDGIEHLDRHLGKNQSADDFIKHGKRDKAGIGDYLKAPLVGLGSEAVDWFMRQANAPSPRGGLHETDYGRLAQDPRVRGVGKAAEAAMALQMDPQTGRFVMGQDYDPKWAAAGFLFGFGGLASPMTPELALGKEVLSNADLIRKVADELPTTKVWSEQLGDYVQTAGYQYGSRTGRAVQRSIERARKAGVHRAVPGFKSGDAKIVDEAKRSIVGNATVLRTWRGKKIMRKGRALRFNKPQHYALRIVANGRSPEDRIAYHLRLAEQAARLGDEQAAANHAIHAEHFKQAARYVEERAGIWHIREDAPKPLRDIERLWGPGQKMREETYLELGLLDEDQVFRRLHMPSWEIDRELSGLRTSAGRARAEAGLRKMFPDDPEIVNQHLAVLDARALATKQKFFYQTDDNIKAVQYRIDTQGPDPDLEEALQNFRLLKRNPEMHPDWYDALHDIRMSFSDEERALYKEQTGRDFDFATSGLSKEEFYAQPWAQRMPILVDTTLAQDPIAVRMGDHIKVGTPGDSHEDLLDHGSDLPPWAQFRNTQQYAVRIDTQGNVINDEYLPVEYYEEAQRRLDAFNEKRWPTEDNFDFARFAEGDQAWDKEITDEMFSRGLPLPPELATKADFEDAVNRVFDLAARSADKRDWYKRAARGAVQIAERHPGGTFLPEGVTPDQAAQIIAIMSQAADTVANVTLARVAIDQYAHFGEVFAGRFPQRQSVEVENVLRGIPWEGRKRSSFYNNIIEDVIGPEEYAARVASGDLVHKPVTVDRWVVRMFRPDAGKDTPDGYYDAFEQTLQLMASKLGWDPKEVQAAAWVSIKADELAKELAQKGRGNVRHLAGAGDAYEYGILKNFPEESQGALFDVPPTHPRALRVRNDARKPDGGGSYDIDLNPVMTEGYSVSYGAFEVRVPANKFAGHHVEAYRDAHKVLLRRQKTSNLGVWHNPEDGVVYLDVSKNFKTKAAAVRFAREQGQLSYWDSKLGASVPTGLEVDEANAIKRALKGESTVQPKIPESLEKSALDQESPKALRDWEALLDKTARRLGWVGKNGKPRALDLQGAEDYLWDMVTYAGDTPLANEVRRLSHEADQAQREAAEAAMDFVWENAPLPGSRVRLGGADGPLGTVVGKDSVGNIYVRPDGQNNALPNSPDNLFPDAEKRTNLVHGLHWIRPDGKGSIHLNPASDSQQAVLAHELAHYDQIMNGMEPQEVKTLRDAGMYPPEGISLNSAEAKPFKERFAWAKVQWLHDVTARGDEVDLPTSVRDTFAALSDRLRPELEKSRLLSHPDAPGPLSEELTELFDDLHSWEELLGARFYLADKRGHATSWRKPMRQINQYMREATFRLGPGRTAITVAGRDISTTTKYRALLMRSGFFKGNATDAIGESIIKAGRLAGFAELHRELVKIGTKTPQHMDDIPMRVDPDIFEPGYAKKYAETGKEVRKALDLMADMETGKRRISYHELDNISMPEIESILGTYFPERLNADKSMPEVIADMINQQDEIENIVWISREALDASALFNNPGTIKAQGLAWDAENLGMSIDMVNNYIKMTMLQLNPAYYFMNFAGNTVMNLMQQGFLYFPNLTLASKLSQAIGEDRASIIDELMGAGVNSIADMTVKGEGGNALPNMLNNMATVLVDRIPRRSAWIHEARKVGFKGEAKLSALLDAADAGDKAALRVTDHITRRAKDAIVDYDRLNPFEKKYLRRIIIFYPWIKGATMWTARFPLEHPFQASAFAALYAYQQWSADKELGHRPWYADLMVPLSIPGVGGLTDEEGNPYVLNPKQLLTMTTPYELGRSVAGLAGLAGGEPFVETLAPVAGAAVTTLAGRRSFDDQEVPQDVGTFLSELDPRQLPLRKKIEGLVNPPEDDSNFLYPRSTLDRWTALFMGSLAPTPYRRSKGEHLAAGKRGITPEIKQSNWAEDYKATYDQEIPAALRAALDAKTEWEKGDQGEKDDEDGLVSAERVLRKFDLLVRHHPEFGQARANIEADVEDPESRRLIDAWIEKALGWNDLDYVRTKVNEAKRGTGTPTINMSRLAALPPSKAWDGSPVVHNADGSTSSVRSMSFNEDGLEVLVPTVWDGAIHSDAEAIARYRRTGEHFGKYRSVSEANAAAKRLHQLEEERGRG